VAAGLGLAPLAKKAALTAGAAPLPLALATVAVAACITGAAVLLREGTRGLRSVPRSAWRHVALVGVLASGAVALLGILAMTGTSATNRGLFQSMYPVATAIAARWLLGERLDRVAYGIIGAMALGLLIMNSEGGGLKLGLPFWLLFATLPLVGLSDVYARRTLEGADPGFVTAGRLVAGSLALALALPWMSAGAWSEMASAWPWVVAAGVATACGLLGLYRAMQSAGASLAAAFAGTAPVITALGEWLVLDARFSLPQLAGIALVVAGAALLAYRV
jgi:transporter family protein